MASTQAIQNLSNQCYTIYKGGGKFVCYSVVIPRRFKEGKDPALSYSLGTTVEIDIFSTEKGESVKAYFEADDPFYLLEKCKANMSRMAPVVAAPVAPTGSNEPKTYDSVKIVFGKLKGLTAREAVLQDEAEAIRHKDFLMVKYNENPTGYKNNETIAKAIEAALKDKASGALGGNAAAAAPVTTIETIIEEMKTPNNTSVDKNGNTVVRILKVQYNVSSREYTVEITNCMAPPAQGQVGAIMSKAVDMKKYSMKFTEKEFFALVSNICRAKDMYARSTEAQQIAYAEAHAWKPIPVASNH